MTSASVETKIFEIVFAVILCSVSAKLVWRKLMREN